MGPRGENHRFRDRDRGGGARTPRRAGDWLAHARGSQSFFVTEMPDRFVRVGRRFFGPEVESAVRIER